MKSLAGMMVLGALMVGMSLPAQASGGMGMTWTKHFHTTAQGVDRVGCGGVCNAYTGDTSCSTALPVLCIKKDGSPTPPGLATDFYNGWTGAHIATTHPIVGSVLTSQVVADQLCAAYFGAGWRMASFHDGNGGWSWYAYGDIRNDMKLWVRISDQPANCWNP
jgi:hypothetical protein